MKLKEGAQLAGLHLIMRPVLKAAEHIWFENGRHEGVTVTAGLDGAHSAGSWHYYGLAVDFRTHYFNEQTTINCANQLREALPGYDIVLHSTHIHVEVGNTLASENGLLT